MTEAQINELEDAIRKEIVEEFRKIVMQKPKTFEELLKLLFSAVKQGTAAGVRKTMKEGAKCTEI